MATSPRPLLNPVLALKRDPRRAAVEGRGVTEASIRRARLGPQRERLSEQLRQVRASGAPTHAGRRLVVVRMFDDSLAPTYEPIELFRPQHGAQLVAPARNGYLAEVRDEYLDALADLIAGSNRIALQVSVSRIEDIVELDASLVLRHRSRDTLWQRALPSDDGRLFTAWLAPFADLASRDSVVRTLGDLSEAHMIAATATQVALSREVGSDTDQLHLLRAAEDTSLARAAREYRQRQYTQVELAVRTPEALDALVASGAVYRIDPVRPLLATQVPTAPDPVRPMPDASWQPVVGVVDGGLGARSYEAMEAWRAPSLVSDVVADRAHGNRVASLVIHGHEWNSHLDLPPLTCRVGIAQAIAKPNESTSTRGQVVSYLRNVIAQHSNETRVWNLSFNEPIDGDEPLEMSSLGHEIHRIAREHNVLPVISIGNVDPQNAARLCPPSDCEAALTVGGRLPDGAGPGTPCPDCLPGPGPEGLLKPELSWFSTLRALGGTPATGSSYAAAITSSLAAHAFHQLKAPTPDLVKALLINTADRDAHDPRVGWGSPFAGGTLPWECPEDAVTLVWTARLRAGQWYYWEDIPIPPELVRDGRLRGRGTLTAVLNPVVSELGSANYFSSRLQVALQYPRPGGGYGNLLGTMKEDVEPELQARAELAKWNPVRHHSKDFSPRGHAFAAGSSLRVCARIFARDLYQFGISSNAEVEPREVAFVLTLRAAAQSSGSSSIYNSVAARLGPYVESAVNDVTIGVEHGV